ASRAQWNGAADADFAYACTSLAGDFAACGRRDAGRCARQAHKRGETKVSPLLRITPFPLGGSRRLSICPKICGICCRKQGRALRARCVTLKFPPPTFPKQQEGRIPPHGGGRSLWGGSQY